MRLTPIRDGFYVAVSSQFATNSVVVRGNSGSLVVDPGVTVTEVQALASDLQSLGMPAEVGFATHPHWDHLIWSPSLGPAPRFATLTAVTTARRERNDLLQELGVAAPGHDLKEFAKLTPIPAECQQLPWSGPSAIVIEHQAHAPGHAALYFPDSGVLLAGDMLSDLEIPLLDLDSPTALADYRQALSCFFALEGVSWVVPGHGFPGDRAEFQRRLAQDQAYLDSLQSGTRSRDPRLATEWLAQEYHRHQAYLAR